MLSMICSYKNIILFPIIVFLFSITEVSTMENPQALLTSAKLKKDIIDWSNTRYAYAKNISIEIDNKEIFVVLADSAFGTTRFLIHVYVYSQEAKEWNLLCLRYTNTSDVKVQADKEKRNLLFISKSNKILFIQPFDTLILGYQAEEQ